MSELMLNQTRVLIDHPLASINALIGSRRALIITDATVSALLPPELAHLPQHIIGEGEQHKTLATADACYAALLTAGIGRADLVVGIGGGVVCDVAAFIASTWQRGCGLILCPTTLLAQVDAALGGKTALNYGSFKNLIGTFYPAEAVVVDPAMLVTLPAERLADGCAELIKHAVIGDADLFAALESNLALCTSPDALGELLPQAMAVKISIVEQDPHEKHLRMVLNFGHTLGHAIEATCGFGHGASVAIGMVAAARLSVQRGLLAADIPKRLAAVLAAAGLPVELTDVDPDTLMTAMVKDKKRRADHMNVALLNDIAQPVIVEMPIDQLRELIHACH